MSYSFSTTLTEISFDDAIEKVKMALQTEGFGVLTEIDMKATMKKKLDKDINRYMILGACNPPFAYEALLAERRIGLMLPCNVIVHEVGVNQIEVAAVDPVASMQAIENDSLGGVATAVQEKLRVVIESL